jgi:hypothetical protein
MAVEGRGGGKQGAGGTCCIPAGSGSLRFVCFIHHLPSCRRIRDERRRQWDEQHRAAVAAAAADVAALAKAGAANGGGGGRGPETVGGGVEMAGG